MAPAPTPYEEQRVGTAQLLQEMLRRGASDLHVKVGGPPGFRVNGSIIPAKEYPPLTHRSAEQLVRQILDPVQFEEFQKDGDFDCAYSIAGLSRFRVNVFRQRGNISMVVRQIPAEIPSIEKLGLPEVCRKLAMLPRGLVLVTGPTGSGKSTTLAAMIDHRNSREAGHILTLEDPIEFVHSDKMSFVSQRGVGSDTESFALALRRALRQDPDVILIGEMRDLETISLALTAAETGHLVFATLHTTGATSTVDRIIDAFPAGQQQQVRLQLAGSLQGVVSQILLPRRGGGRIAAHEILVAVDAIRACIREGKTAQMVNSLQTGGKYGMQVLDADLARLVQAGLVDREDALAKAHKPEDLESVLGGARPPAGRPEPSRPVAPRPEPVRRNPYA